MIFLLLALCFGFVSVARADTQILPLFNGSYFTSGPFPTYVVGTFNILPGDGAITISGTWGDTTFNNGTAGEDLYLGGVLVAQCIEFAACWQGPITPWSDTLTPAEIASLGTGLVDFTAAQTSVYEVNLGPTTLDQTQVPEPGSLVLLGSGLAAVALVTRLRKGRSLAAGLVGCR
jgi:hypothetical protein